MPRKKNKVDKFDIKIVNLLINSPNITYSEVAKNIHKSQPAAGNRIKKLEEKGLENIWALNFNKIQNFFGTKIGNVKFFSKNFSKTRDKFSKCPYISNIFNITGEFNCQAIIVANNMKIIEEFVNRCIRNNGDSEGNKKSELQFIIGSSENFFIQVPFEVITRENFHCNNECGQKLEK